MCEKWQEEIKHNDAVSLLKRYFPDEIFGSKAEKIAEICRITKAACLSKDERLSNLINLQIFPLDDLEEDNGRRIVGKRYVSDSDASRSGACRQCVEYDGRVFDWPGEASKMPVLPRHPNCKCHYENEYEENISADESYYFRVKDAPGKFRFPCGGIEFNGNEDFIKKLEGSNIPPHSIKELVIVGHSGCDNSYNMGDYDDFGNIKKRKQSV